MRRATLSMATREHGIALVTAMLIAALVTAGAVALATSQQFDTRRVANILGVDRAAFGVESLEGQAHDLLRDDAKRGRYDALDEEWTRTTLKSRAADLEFEGRLRDLQGRFNLTNLSAEPAFAGDVGADGQAAGSGAAASAPAPEDTAAGAATAASAETPAPTPATPAPAVAAASPGPTSAPGTAPAPGAGGDTNAQAEQQLRLLFKALELDPEPVQAILDWIDPDTEMRFPNGAEDDYYTEQEPAYRAANRPLLSVRELLLIRGVTEETYRKLAPFVVCLPQASRINVNTAPKEVLMSLSPTLDSSAVAGVLRARDTQPFLSIDAFARHPLLQFRNLATGNLTVESEYFELRSVARNARLDFRTSSLLARSGAEVATLRRWRENFDE